MRKAAILLSLLAAMAVGCERPVAAVATAPHESGPRWVVIKSEGLNCTSCAAALTADLQQVAGVTQIETFAPQPYCRFHVEDGELHVRAMIDELKVQHAALEGYVFVRGG